MKNRVLEMAARAEASGGYYNLRDFAGSVRNVSFENDRFVLDTEDFLFVVGLENDSLVLLDLAGEGEDNHPLLRELIIDEEDLQALSEGNSPELRYPARLAWLASEGMKKLGLEA